MSATSTWAHDHQARVFVDTKTASRHLSLHPDTLRRLRREGGGPRYSRIGRAVRYDLRELERWMAERSVNHVAEEAARGGEA